MAIDTKPALAGAPTDPIATSLKRLISAARTVNHSPGHLIKIGIDDDPCYWQRVEWVEYLLEECDEAEATVQANSKKDTAAQCQCSMRQRMTGDGCEQCNPDRAADLSEPEELIDADWLSNIIREVDGNHSLGAGALAELLAERINRHLQESP